MKGLEIGCLAAVGKQDQVLFHRTYQQVRQFYKRENLRNYTT